MTTKTTKTTNVVDLFDMVAVEATTNFLEKSSFRADGLYKPVVKDSIDKTKGYTSIIRFLPNFLPDLTLGQAIIEKEVYYVKDQDFSGYYDSQKPFATKCPLNTLQWHLKNSKNPVDVDRSKLIQYTKKFYSYILVVEDKNKPELEGKILVFPYGFKIKEKIEAERLGNNSEGEKCNPFDIVRGKDFKLIIKEVGSFPNYDSSLFMLVSPLKISNDKGQLVPMDMKDPNIKTKVNEFLLNRDVKLEDNGAKTWTPEQHMKINALIQKFTGAVVTAPKGMPVQPTNLTDITTDEFFDNMGDED